jgi:hypothetical protein
MGGVMNQLQNQIEKYPDGSRNERGLGPAKLLNEAAPREILTEEIGKKVMAWTEAQSDKKSRREFFESHSHLPGMS